MSNPAQDRRRPYAGSIICENGALRLRVTRQESSLGLALDARDAQGVWALCAVTPGGGDLQLIDAAGAGLFATYFAFDPVLVDGETRGVSLQGKLGDARVTSTCLLMEQSTWSQHALEIDGLAEGGCQQLAQRWELSYDFLAPELCWPAKPVHGHALVWNPAAFCQRGPYFAGLLPDSEEGAGPQLGMRLHVQELPLFEYGILPRCRGRIDLPKPLRLAYHLCLDARARPGHGYQQIVRLLGSREPLAIAGDGLLPAPGGALPELPSLPARVEWTPFTHEGSPAAIAALVGRLFARAEDDAWEPLEEGLRWLDRLCLHQRVIEVPGGGPIGAFGGGAAWEPVAPWLPVLLLAAFRLTGITEYASRAFAALAALPVARRAAAMTRIAPHFGDIYLHPEFCEALTFAPVEIIDAQFAGEEILLEIVPISEPRPLRLVVDGMADRYTLVVNCRRYADVPSERLRAGIEVEIG